MKQVNSWTHWQPLKQVVLANVYPPEFFEDIKDTKLRDSLQKVVHETKEDLDGIKKTLKDLDVENTEIWDDENIEDFKQYAKEKPNKDNLYCVGWGLCWDQYDWTGQSIHAPSMSVSYRVWLKLLNS